MELIWEKIKKSLPLGKVGESTDLISHIHTISSLVSCNYRREDAPRDMDYEKVRKRRAHMQFLGKWVQNRPHITLPNVPLSYAPSATISPYSPSIIMSMESNSLLTCQQNHFLRHILVYPLLILHVHLSPAGFPL